jgi:hypothetical protein
MAGQIDAINSGAKDARIDWANSLFHIENSRFDGVF